MRDLWKFYQAESKKLKLLKEHQPPSIVDAVLGKFGLERIAHDEEEFDWGAQAPS